MSYGNDRPPKIEENAGPGRVVIVLFGVFFFACVVFICGGMLLGLVGHFGSIAVEDEPEAPGPNDKGAVSNGKRKRPGTFTVLDWKTEFESPALPGDETDLAGIERLFDTLLAATEAGNKVGIRDCFDDDRRFEEVSASRLWPNMTWHRLAEYKAAMPAEDVMPQLTRRYKIVSVRPMKQPSEVVVSGYFWSGESECAAFQFRLVRRGRWRVFDVAESGFGLTGTERDVLYLLMPIEGGPAYQEFEHARKSIEESHEMRDRFDRAGATAKLRGITLSTLRSDLADDFRIIMALNWMHWDDPKQVVAVADSIQNKDSASYAHYFRAWAHSRQGKHESVIEAGEALARFPGESIRFAPQLAAAYESLDRPAEAAEVWRKLLRADPAGLAALTGLARSLDESEQAFLTDHLKSLPTPLKTCETLLSQSYRLGDRGAHELLSRLIGELAPGSATAERAKGRLADYQGEAEVAAGHFANAFALETDPEVRKQIIWEYVNAMIEAEQYLRAYTEGPDPNGTFEYLVNLQGDEDADVIDRRTWDALLAARREKHPYDPWAHLLAGRLRVEDDDFATAEREFAAGLKLAKDEDLRDQLRYERDMALANLGRATEAYLAAKDSAEAFQSLASQLQAAEKDDDLAKLVALHRTRAPTDPWLNLYAGQLKARAKDWAGAEHLFVQGERYARENWLKSSYRRERTSMLIEAYGIAEAYRRLGGTSPLFVEMVRPLQHRSDTIQMEQLVAAHRQAMPRDPQLFYWETVLLQLKKDDVGYLRHTTNVLHATWSTLDEHQRREIVTHSVRILVRRNQMSEAVARARMPLLGSDPFPSLLAEAASGNVEESARLMREFNQQRNRIHDPYHDEDLGKILRTAPFLPLREEFPPPLFGGEAGTASVVVLLGSPGRLVEADLLQWIPESLRGTARLLTLPDEAKGEKVIQTPLLVARVGDHVASVTSGAGRYATDAERSVPLNADDALKQIVHKHDGWLHIAVRAPSESGVAMAQSLAGQMAAAIVRSDAMNAQAIYWPQRFRLKLADDGALSQLSAGQEPESALSEGDGRLAWFLDHEEAGSGPRVRQSQRRAREFRAAWARRRPGEQFSVQVELSLGEGVERVWLDVTRRLPNTYGAGQLHARLNADSILRPELKSGEPVALFDLQLTDWRAK